MKERQGQTNNRANRLADESGVITLDFIFALAIAFGFSILFFAMSFTLSMVEVCQYITFSAARTYYGANVSQQAQVDLGKAKYAELKGKGIFKSLFKSGWINLGDIEFGDFSDEYNDESAGRDAIFEGARVPFKANVLNLRLPFLGNTASDTSTGKAVLNAYLMREVSTEECQGFTKQRLAKLKEVDSRYQSVQGNEVIITDNGC
jgi:hypothetical protein